ncbi:MAG: DUF4250 domain-containing protein [Paramuribaculum sp.]|nr:DUF4250 domain-containing protein [Paramuribaculum sp.]MDE5837208.1 DUF4250 domain-containing protein [Paramuribaculum sp.]
MDNDFSKLPSDPAMLMSFVNMKLRDNYASLEDLCDDMSFDVDLFLKYMLSKGWEYNKDGKKFW